MSEHDKAEWYLRFQALTEERGERYAAAGFKLKADVFSDYLNNGGN